MMTELHHQLASWGTIGGTVFGFFLGQCVAWTQCRLKDWRDPLPGGHRRRVGNVNRRWVAGAIAVLGVAAVTVNQQNFAQSVLSCFRDYGGALKGNVAMINEDNSLSLQQRHLLATRTKINTDLILVGDSDQVRRLYLATQAVQLDQQIDAVNQRQEQLDQERRAHPLPELTCGK